MIEGSLASTDSDFEPHSEPKVPGGTKKKSRNETEHKEEPIKTVGRVKTNLTENSRRPSLFPTVNDVPEERSRDEYGRKKEIDFSRRISILVSDR